MHDIIINHTIIFMPNKQKQGSLGQALNQSEKAFYQDHQEEQLQPLQEQSQIHQNTDIHPNYLSGDQNGEQSILVSTTDQAKSNRLLTAASIVKTVIGSGILTIPYTMYKMGYVLGIILFIGGVCLNQFGSVLLLKSKNLSRHSNYATILYAIWPSRIAKGIGSIIVFLTCIGVCIADLILFKTTVHKLLGDILGKQQVLDQFYANQFFIVAVIALLEAPLTMATRIEKLKFMGLSGVIGIVILMLSFVVYYVLCVFGEDIGSKPVGGMEMFPQDWFGAAAAVPNIFFAITFQNNLFPLFKGMKGPTDKRMAWVAFSGVIFCATSYILIGLLGYNYIGQGVQANFLQSFQYVTFSKPFFFMLNGSFLISIFFAFPIMFFGCRNNFIALIKLALVKKVPQNKWRASNHIQEISSFIKSEQYTQRKRKARLYFVIYTIIIYLMIVGISMAVDDIQVVFNAIGAICAASICPLLPCYFYFRLVVIKKQPKNIKFYVAIVIFSIMAPYSIFSILSLYLK